MHEQDFVTNYTETDVAGDRLTVKKYRVEWDDMDKTEGDIRATRDFGADYFDGDFLHLFSTAMTVSSVSTTSIPWGVYNNDSGVYDQVSASQSFLNLWLQTNSGPVHRFLLEEADAGSYYTDTYTSVSVGTTYYIEVERDESQGTYGTLYCRIYSDGIRTTLVDTLSVALHTSKKDFRYMTVGASYDNNSSAAHQDGFIENLILTEDLTAGDNEQNLFAYAKKDEQARLTVESDKVTSTSLDQDEDAYLAKDFGAAHFSGDFLHTFNMNTTARANTSITAYWAMANELGSVGDLYGNLDPYVHVRHQQAFGILLNETDSAGSSTYDNYAAAATSTDYYIEVERDEAVGANGTMYCRIYSDSTFSTLVDVLSITLTFTADWRYLYAHQAWDTGTSGRTQSGYTADLNIHEDNGCEVLTDYTEDDTNGRFTVYRNRIDFSGLQRADQDHIVYTDKGADYYDGDFLFTVAGQADTANNDTLAICWAVTNDVDDIGDIDTNSGDALWCGFQDTAGTDSIKIQELAGGTAFNDSYASMATGTKYWLEIERDESIGSFGSLICRIFGTAGRTNAVDTLALALHEKEDFRYLYAIGTKYDAAKTNTISGSFDSLKELSAPTEYENYKDYTLVTDTTQRIFQDDYTKTRFSTRRNDSDYLYKDFGASYFSADFTHTLEAEVNNYLNSGHAVVWGMANAVDDFKGLRDASEDYLSLLFFQTNGTGAFLGRFDLNEADAGTDYKDRSPATAELDARYYIDVERVMGDSANGSLYARIYEDIHKTRLWDQLALDLRNDYDWRYLYAASSRDTGSDYRLFGAVYNLNLNEDDATTIPIFAHHYKMLMRA